MVDMKKYFFLVVVCAFGCKSSTEPTNIVPGEDASMPAHDAGTPTTDAGVDSGTAPNDAGTPPVDSGTPEDAGPPVNILEALDALANVRSVTEISRDGNYRRFSIEFSQPLDHFEQSGREFSHWAILLHRDQSRTHSSSNKRLRPR